MTNKKHLRLDRPRFARVSPAFFARFFCVFLSLLDFPLIPQLVLCVISLSSDWLLWLLLLLVLRYLIELHPNSSFSFLFRRGTNWIISKAYRYNPKNSSSRKNTKNCLNLNPKLTGTPIIYGIKDHKVTTSLLRTITSWMGSLHPQTNQTFWRWTTVV